MSRVLIAAVIFGVGLSAPAHAKKEKSAPPPPECPTDTIIRTASSQLLKNFTVLAGCSEQVVVAQATPEEFAPEEDSGAENDQASLPADQWSNQFAIERSAAQIKISTGPAFAINRSLGDISSRAMEAGTVLASDTDVPYTVRYLAKRGVGIPYAGTGAVISIKPSDQDFRAVDLGAPPIGGSADFSSRSAIYSSRGYADTGQTSAISGNAILVMRPQTYRTQYDAIISDTALRHRIDPLFLHAVIKQESGYRTTVASHAGARGLMQIMPATGRSLGVDPSNLTNATTNVDAGARLLRKLYFKYSGNFDLVLAAYNAGEGAVQKYGNRIPPYKETQDYVRSVMAIYYKLLAEQNALTAIK